jgi:hypothetical protein
LPAAQCVGRIDQNLGIMKHALPHDAAAHELRGGDEQDGRCQHGPDDTPHDRRN